MQWVIVIDLNVIGCQLHTLHFFLSMSDDNQCNHLSCLM